MQNGKKPRIRNYMTYAPNGDKNDNKDKKNVILLDDLNINIIKELSVIQRRKAGLERSLLNKNYEINVRDLGWRIADIYLKLAKGKSKEVAKNS